MKRPSFQFYPADWRGNNKLRRCSGAARGAWMDILCTLHDSDEYGLVRWPLAELASVAGVSLKLARELADKTVLKGSDTGPVFFAHTPRHAGKNLEPVTLVEGMGPIWFSSRMLTDEWRRRRSGGDTKFTADNQPSRPPDNTPSRSPSRPLGDGSTTSSPSPSPKEDTSLRSVLPLEDAPVPASPKKRKAKPRQEMPGFAEFYTEYPLKKAPADAAKAYAAARSRATAEAILAGARRYAASRVGEDPQFTKHPATWLNKDCWLDQELTPGQGGQNGSRNPKSSGNGTSHERHRAGWAKIIDDEGGGDEVSEGPPQLALVARGGG